MIQVFYQFSNEISKSLEIYEIKFASEEPEVEKAARPQSAATQMYLRKKYGSIQRSDTRHARQDADTRMFTTYSFISRSPVAGLVTSSHARPAEGTQHLTLCIAGMYQNLRKTDPDPREQLGALLAEYVDSHAAELRGYVEAGGYPMNEN